jgi:hypothetical protein
MKIFVQLMIVLAGLASGACKADEAGLCKPMCAEEKRVCRVEANKLIDVEAKSLTMWREKNPMAREFGNGGVQSNQPQGPAARNTQDRKMTRNQVCEDKYLSCAKACN